MKKTIRDAAEILGAFIAAFAVYQILILITGTQLPIVSVVSDSMYHKEPFDQWWEDSGRFYEKLGIDKREFLSYRNFNGLSKGDMLFVVKQENLTVGDIVIYQRDSTRFTIVHRIVEIDGNEISTKGDNNAIADKSITKQNVQGKVVFAVPILGYPRFLLHLIGV